MRSSIQHNAAARFWRLSPRLLRDLGGAAQELGSETDEPATGLLTAQDIRRFVRKLVELG